MAANEYVLEVLTAPVCSCRGPIPEDPCGHGETSSGCPAHDPAEREQWLAEGWESIQILAGAPAAISEFISITRIGVSFLGADEMALDLERGCTFEGTSIATGRQIRIRPEQVEP